ncbi:MAG TPA: hypothetical protein VNA25_22640 [Phycisphaerae bacterium]|nr:hypothetical protein [Phycisphaerae bacterium]
MRTYVGADFVGKTVEAVIGPLPFAPLSDYQGARQVAAITFTDGTFTFMWGEVGADPRNPGVFIPPDVHSSWAIRRLIPFGICTEGDALRAEASEAAEHAARTEKSDREEYARLKAKYGDPAHQKEGG